MGQVNPFFLACRWRPKAVGPVSSSETDLDAVVAIRDGKIAIYLATTIDYDASSAWK
jgi:hypothetical protein